MDKIIAWKNYFTDAERTELLKECKNYNWMLTGHSQNNPESRTFWFKSLNKSTFIVNLFTSKIEEYLDKKIQLSRVYANGQAHGQCGEFHKDVEPAQEGEFCSLVYYLHEDWKPEYGGHIMIKNGDQYESYWPESNSAILFNSKWDHCPLEPTVYCKKQRESIAFKFRIL